MVTTLFAGLSLSASASSVMNGFPLLKFTDRALLDLVAVELVTAAVALAFLYLCGWRQRDFQFDRDWRLGMVGAALFLVTVAVNVFYETVARTVIPGAEMLAQIVDASVVSWPVVALVSLVNGVYEEYFLLHYLVEANASHGLAFALGISALVRVSYHFYQGPFGAIAVLLWCVVASMSYWRVRRVWPVMVAHVLTDAVALGEMVK